MNHTIVIGLSLAPHWNRTVSLCVQTGVKCGSDHTISWAMEAHQAVQSWRDKESDEFPSLTMAMTAAPAPARAQMNKWNVRSSWKRSRERKALLVMGAKERVTHQNNMHQARRRSGWWGWRSEGNKRQWITRDQKVSRPGMGCPGVQYTVELHLSFLRGTWTVQ